MLGEEVLRLVERDCVPGGTRNNLLAAERTVDWTDSPDVMRIVLCDAQTSGGLLLCVSPRRVDAVKKILAAQKTLAAAVIGKILAKPVGGIIVRK